MERLGGPPMAEHLSLTTERKYCSIPISRIRLVTYLQRVLQAAVRVGGEDIATISRGLLVLFGAEKKDDEKEDLEIPSFLRNQSN